MELIATMMRLGWLYLISPIRLCSNYLLDDQQRLGKILLVAGFAILLVLVWKLVWGHVDSGRADREDARIGSD
jgi:type II secretory pathway component PulM